MKFSPHFLGIFSDIYGSNDAMNISKALLVALVGFMTVLLVLAAIALFIKFIAFIFSIVEKKKSSKPTTIVTPINDSPTPKKTAVTLPDNESQGELELVGVDEATAAILMALVSYKTEIPLNRLAFRSIKFVEEVE